MKRWALSGLGVVAVAGAAVFAFNGDDDSEPPPSGSASLEVPAAPAGTQPVEALTAEPQINAETPSLLGAVPADSVPGGEVTFQGTWATPDGHDVSGEVEIQRIDGRDWTSVATMTADDGVGTAQLEVPEAGIYRLAYGGSAELEAMSSPELVIAGPELMPSLITITAAPGDDDAEGAVDITGTWTTDGGVPIIGELQVQAAQDGEWVAVGSVRTGGEGTGAVTLEVGDAARLRVAYPGGSRFAEVASTETLALGGDVRTIPVTTCTSDHDIDVLPRGAGCHYTPVDESVFVVGHDYLDNAWWNAVAIGGYVQLEGEQAGVYEVVDRVIAPGRGSELSPPSRWACGDECDVILQTCQGSNTGFTWLRRVET